MKTIFETCVPRREVLQGELREDTFAARLRDVMVEEAASVYKDGNKFFENTYPTTGLKALLNEALRRLTGAKPTGSPVIRLETAFGGGKTHNLIALFHIARKNADAEVLRDFVDPMLIPEEPVTKVAGVVGTDMDPDNGINHGDVTTYTLWGEIAYQLGGIEAFKHVEKNDRSGISPGSQALENIVGDGPSLIMVDEIARYLRSGGVKQVSGGKKGDTLSKQTVAFFHTLIEYAISRPNVVFVFTLAESHDAFGRETEEILLELEEIKKISARQERVLRPTIEGEISAIVNHRLFESINRDEAEKTASTYLKYYRSLQDVTLPAKATTADYRDEIVNDYPFHPELLLTLNRKTSTIPNFQKTRGALRLLALVIKELWEKKPYPTYMIHPHNIDLTNNIIENELTSRLQRQAFSSVIEADIYSSLSGSISHADIIDEEWTGVGKPPYARRLSTIILLHSLTQATASGVEPEYLWVSTLQPQDDPAILNKALNNLEKKCWFLDFDGYRYRFKTEPSLNKIIDDEMSVIGNTKPKKKIEEMIRRNWKSGIFDVKYFPSEPGEIDDDAGKPKLGVIHFDAAKSTMDNEIPPELIIRLFKHAGAAEGFRKYKNNLIFLVADESQVEEMVIVAKRYMAILRIMEDETRITEFSEENQKKIKEYRDSSGLRLRVSINKAYRYLYYPTLDAPKKADNLARGIMPMKEHGSMEDQAKAVLELLRSMEKVLTEKEKPLSPQYVKSKAWGHKEESITTGDLQKAFAQKFSLKILLDINQLKKTVIEGIKRGQWIYYDAEKEDGYGPNSPAPVVKFSEEVYLYTPEEAKRLGIVAIGDEVDPPEEKCEVCGKNVKDCICHEDPPGPVPPSGLKGLSSEGAVGKVFQDILDQAKDQEIKKLKTIEIGVDGEGKGVLQDAKGLELVVPQMGASEIIVIKELIAELDPHQHFKLSFKGSWKNYRKIKDTSQSLEDVTSKIRIEMMVSSKYSNGIEVNGSQYKGIKESLIGMGLGKITLKAEPFEE